ncbi:MAG: pyruvate kinase [Chloroflexi bacterium]|nr:pyruvate kinase [Chloroflexota bacterium]
MNRRVKIAATIGPSSKDEATIKGLLKAGMNIARLNFSHGTHEEHALILNRLKSIAHELSSPLAIMQDLQGPKIRVGNITAGSVNLIPNQSLNLTIDPIDGNENIIPVDLPQLPEIVQAGDRILLDDGNLEISVVAVSKEIIQTKVITGGELKSNKGINLPGKRINIPSLSEKDIEDLAFGLQQGVDAVALSFVRTSEDIYNLKNHITRLNSGQKNPSIIAKIEKPEALDNLESIVSNSDGVIVARGDLGVELSPAMVPIIQKRIITCANNYGKVVFIATQLLESMITNVRPTRAEASDIANAVFDGTDAVLLTGETAAGNHPVLVVQTMDIIIKEAEKHMAEWGKPCISSAAFSSSDDAFFIAQAAHELARDRNVAAISVFTQTGRTAQLLAKTRPDVDILAFTPNPDVYHQLNMLWGVTPYLVPYVDTIENMIRVVDEKLLSSSDFQPGQQMVMVCGFPIKTIRPANMTIIHTIGESI